MLYIRTKLQALMTKFGKTMRAFIKGALWFIGIGIVSIGAVIALVGLSAVLMSVSIGNLIWSDGKGDAVDTLNMRNMAQVTPAEVINLMAAHRGEITAAMLISNIMLLIAAFLFNVLAPIMKRSTQS